MVVRRRPTLTGDRIRWGQLACIVVAGLAIAAVGVLMNVAWAWTDIWPQVFLTVGSTFALGGVLFVLQRSWVEEVSEEVQQFGEEARSAVQAMESRTDELRQQLESRRPLSLDELRDLVTQTSDSMTTRRRSAMEVLKSDLSFANLSVRPRHRTGPECNCGRIPRGGQPVRLTGLG